MMALLTFWKPITAAFVLGLLLGAIGGHKYATGQEAKQEVRALKTEVLARDKASARREVAASAHEADREQIDADNARASDEVDNYLQQRADLRAIDLGTDWLCIIDTAAGVAAPRCAGQPAAGLPGTTGAGGFEPASNATGSSAVDAPPTNLHQPPSAAGAGSDPATGPSGRH